MLQELPAEITSDPSFPDSNEAKYAFYPPRIYSSPLQTGAFMKLRTLTALGIGFLYAQLGLAATPTDTATTVTTTTPATQITTTTPTTTGQPANLNLATDKEKISYSIGVDLGSNFKNQNIDIDPNLLARGLQDSMNGSPLLLTQQQMGDTLMAFQKQLIAKKQATFAASSTTNKTEGDTFLASNKTKPGVVTTPSGLQYKVITKGNGQAPTDNDVVTVDYSGNFINGKEFDSSYKRGKPVVFPVSQVIAGWTEALKLMQPGATYEIFVPPTLAYGATGFGNAIGPNQTLIFKIHLISVKPAGKQS